MKLLDRRDFLRLSGAGTVGLTLNSMAANAQVPHTRSSTTTRPLKYVHATDIEGQYCTDCMYILQEDGTQVRQCGTFPEKSATLATV